MEYNVYFDESGDLGWTLDQPYRKGGSSRFFTIAYIILLTEKNKYISRFIKKFHKDRGGKEKEIKGADFRNVRTKTIARNIIDLFERNNDIIVGSLTVKKSNVPDILLHAGNDNILYNYMVQLGICPRINSFSKVNIIPDKRSVPSGSQNSCSDQLKSKLWLESNSSVEITYEPKESYNNAGLMFIDWIANFIWRHYEDNSSEAYHTLKPYLKEDFLFF